MALSWFVENWLPASQDRAIASSVGRVVVVPSQSRPVCLFGGFMAEVKTVEVVDSKGNKIVVNEEDAGNYKKASTVKPSIRPKKK